MGKRIRKAVQVIWGLLSNGYVKGFFAGGKIYTGPLKRFCVPGLNCYSCPGALGACPIGSLQALFSGRNRKAGFYVLGFLASVGILFGRFVCGWLCLFGLVQELLYRIPVPKIAIPEKTDRKLRYLKYAVLLITVVALPLLYRDGYGSGIPFFCKYICPAGTLEAGIPLVILDRSVRSAVGFLFSWKVLLLILFLVSSMFIYRPFCRYICPLGAFYALFQRISILRLSFDESVCAHCGACQKACAMKVNPCASPNSPECIRCGECLRVCPRNALAFTIHGRRRTSSKAKQHRKSI